MAPSSLRASSLRHRQAALALFEHVHARVLEVQAGARRGVNAAHVHAVQVRKRLHQALHR